MPWGIAVAISIELRTKLAKRLGESRAINFEILGAATLSRMRAINIALLTELINVPFEMRRIRNPGYSKPCLTPWIRIMNTF
jgi:hypothetical protein